MSYRSIQAQKQQREVAANALKGLRETQQQNLQEYLSQASEQYQNDFESLSKPSMKSMPVRTNTKELLQKYKGQLDFKPNFIVVTKPAQEDSGTKEQPFEILPKELQQYCYQPEAGHSLQSEKPPNPFTQIQEEQEMSFSKNDLLKESAPTEQRFEAQYPFENSMQYTQTQNLDQFNHTQTEKASQLESLQDSSHIQPLSQTQERSLDSQRFNETGEKNSTRRFDLHQQQSAVAQSIQEDIDAEGSEHSNMNERVDEEDMEENQESRLIDTYGWSDNLSVPQGTAQFTPNPALPTGVQLEKAQGEVARSNFSNPGSSHGSKLIEQQKPKFGGPDIQKKLSHELVVDIDRLENSRILKSINRTQMLYMCEKYFQNCLILQNRELLQMFLLLRSVQKMNFKRQQTQLAQIMQAWKYYVRIQSEKYEKDRKVRQFNSGQRVKIMRTIFDMLTDQRIVHKQIEKNAISALQIYRTKIIWNKWKYKTYTSKVKYQMLLQYKLTLFNAWQRTASSESKRRNTKALTHYYFAKIGKYFKKLKFYCFRKAQLHSKFFKSIRAVQLLKKQLYLNQMKQFVAISKKEKEFEAFAKGANEFIPVEIQLKPNRVKLYNLK